MVLVEIDQLCHRTFVIIKLLRMPSQLRYLGKGFKSIGEEDEQHLMGNIRQVIPADPDGAISLVNAHRKKSAALR